MFSECTHGLTRGIRSPVCSRRDLPTDRTRWVCNPVTVGAIDGNRLRIGPIEAIDGTPVVDIKPALK